MISVVDHHLMNARKNHIEICIHQICKPFGIVEENGEKFMLFYGMSSESAMKRHVGGVAEYRGKR